MRLRDRSIDVIKGLAIILVVCGHIIQRNSVLISDDFFLNPVFKWIYSFHMPLFVFLGGYLMADSLERKSGKEVFYSRLNSLLVPFFVWSVLGIITNYALDLVDGKKTVGCFLWSAVDQLALNPAVWFLSTLFLSSVLLLFSVQLQKRFGMTVPLIVVVLLWLVPWNQYAGIYYVQWFYPFYLAGYFVRNSRIKISASWLAVVMMVVALAAFLVLVGFWNKGDYIYINKMTFDQGLFSADGARLIYRYAVGFLGIFLFWNVGDRLSKWRTGAVLGYIGVYSLDIYLIQRYLVEGLYPRLASRMQWTFDPSSPAFLYFYVPLAALAFTFICLLLSKVLIRKNDLLNRLLLGAR